MQRAEPRAPGPGAGGNQLLLIAVLGMRGPEPALTALHSRPPESHRHHIIVVIIIIIIIACTHFFG